MNTISPTTAELLNLRPLTLAYSANEIGMLERAAEQLGNIQHAFVQTAGGIELWRSTNGMTFETEEP